MKLLENTETSMWINLIEKQPEYAYQVPEEVLEDKKFQLFIRDKLLPEFYPNEISVLDNDQKLWIYKYLMSDFELHEPVNSMMAGYPDPVKMMELTGYPDPVKKSKANEILVMIVKWIVSEDPILTEYSTLTNAIGDAREWNHEKERKNAREGYKTNEVFIDFGDGFKAVKVNMEDLESERFFIEGLENFNIQEGQVLLYSIRNELNEAVATTVIDKFRMAEKELNVSDIFGTKEYNEVEDDYKLHVKGVFDKLRGMGYSLESPTDTSVDTEIWDLEELDIYDEYGFELSYTNIGGSIDNYVENINKILDKNSGSYFNSSAATTTFKLLLEFAKSKDEESDLYSAISGIEKKTIDNFHIYIDQSIMENHYPDEDDFTLFPDQMEDQPEFGKEYDGEPKIDYEAYDKACDAYHNEVQEMMENDEFISCVINMLNLTASALQDKEDKDKKDKNNIENKGVMNIKFTKTAEEEEETLSPSILATYIEALKVHLNDPKINQMYKEMIKKLPPSYVVRKTLSNEECSILFETVDYLWKKISGSSITKEEEMIKAPESLKGCYWLLKHGILMHGQNHFTIAKRNKTMLVPLLNLNTFTFEEYLSSDPQKLIYYLIDNGAVRVFVNKDKNAFFQMMPEVYADWGKKKVQRYDMKKKVVRVIDRTVDYNGWKSGVAVKLH